MAKSLTARSGARGGSALTLEVDRQMGVLDELTRERVAAERRRDLVLDWGLGTCYIWSGFLFLATPVASYLYGFVLTGGWRGDGFSDWSMPELLLLLSIPATSFLSSVVVGFWWSWKQALRMSPSAPLASDYAWVLGICSGLSGGVVAGLTFPGTFVALGWVVAKVPGL